MPLRRMLPFILINIFVSAAVVLSILFWWDGRQAAEAGGETAVIPPVANEDGGGETAVVPDAEVAAPETPPEPEPTDAPPLHIVQAGETLSTISLIYDVSVEDIMAANNMTNANLISAGQQLLIPINGLEEPTPIPADPTNDPNIIPTPIATLPTSGGDDFVVEISQVAGAGEVAAEVIQIRNTGSDSVALQNWRIADQDGLFYTFGQVTLFGDGAGIFLYSGQGQDGVTEFYWGLSEPVWQPGELVTLLDANGDIATTFTVSE